LAAANETPSFGPALPFRVLNAVGRGLMRTGFGKDLLRVDRLLAAASRETGLDDFGDPGFREPLGVLARACDEEAGLSFLGRITVRRQLIQLLKNRLEVQDFIKKNPWVRDVILPPPLVVAGLPRTGTTLLHRLLSQDPRSRAPRLWEMSFPTPPPAPAEEVEARDVERRRATERKLQMVYLVAPELRAIHPMEADDAEECHALLQHTFVSEIFTVQFRIPTYQRYIMSLGRERMREVYEYQRLLLQILTARRRGEHMVLKWPGHLLHLDSFLDVFPDACVIQTHRDPLEVVPSACSLFAHARAARCEELDLEQMRDDVVWYLREIVQRSQAVRDRANPERFFDLRYTDLMRDPVGSVCEIYDHFGLYVEHDFEENMRRWLGQDQRGGKSHTYSLDHFHLDERTLSAEFAEYCDRYRLPSKTERRSGIVSKGGAQEAGSRENVG
jgi:hypothetical protein